MLSSNYYLPIAGLAVGTSATALGAYNVDPNSVSVSGLSIGEFMAAQLGVAYPDTLIVLGHKTRKIYMQVGTSDTMSQLKGQLAKFADAASTTHVTTQGAAHTFPTDFDGAGDNQCGFASSPYISNCKYDGAGAVLKWMYGELAARNSGSLSGEVVSFDQSSSFRASGMDSTGYLYVPAACKNGSTVCKLHVALHGCLQSHSQIQSKFVDNTDTNKIIVVFPQAIADSSTHTVWSGSMLPNPNACWDWVGWYGNNADQKGGVQMAAIVNQVNQVISGHQAGGGSNATARAKAALVKRHAIRF
ncbi:hypothetical protein N7481_000531 [Penicillium waksmanii]|uniref:uncharacterized protein n=1 Tax=Penicillium waksmanii TaxID=69791 RepID=UPI002548A149|nr:uncharacterized protein N7481_000531 [Penicillium waksmanii]KAJ6000122.1 hypothetical protein N7481_000531 [Penicillium waksmanii]